MKNKILSVSKITEKSLAEQALTQFNAKRYKDAIRLYKKLLQEDDTPAVHEKLAHCYVQRAIGFAAKGMYQEALVLWENHQIHGQAPYAAYDQYLVWLIQVGDLDKVQTGLNQLSAAQLDKDYPKLANVLGLLILTKYPELQQYIPQESAFMRDLQTVQLALQAMQDKSLQAVQDALKPLPYRSAFKDLRTLLHAISLMPESVEQVQIALAKITDASVYYPSAQLIKAISASGAELGEQLVRLNYSQRQLVGKLNGLADKQLAFIEHFSRQFEQLTHKVQFKLAIQYQDLFGSHLAEQFCRLVLIHYPAGQKEFNKGFVTLNEFEENRIKALQCEDKGHQDDAEYHWKLCIRILLHSGKEDAHLAVALIQRRLAVREKDELVRAKWLAESLQYDAGHRDSYLHLLKIYQQQEGRKEEYKACLNKALAQFPQDVEILAQAIKAALKNKTYKKAAQYARKLLAIDPLNTFAKQTLFSSHVAHAQRLMREKKYDLVAKEIAQLEKLNLGKQTQQTIQLMQALLTFASGNKQEGLPAIVTAVHGAYSDPVNAQFAATMSALLNGLPVATILRELAPVKESILTAAELKVLIRQLQQYIDMGVEQTLLHKALVKIKAPLKKSLLTQNYAEALVLQFCEVLIAIQHFELLRHYAKFAHAQWQKPIWMYYRVYADVNGVAADCGMMEVSRLQYAHKDAKESKDYASRVLIESFLDRYYEAHPQRAMGFFDAMFGFDDADDLGGVDPMDVLFGDLPNDILAELNDVAEEVATKHTPEELIAGLVQEVGNQEAVFMALLRNSDIFPSLLLLKAAEQLKIDIGVGVNDIIEVFSIEEKNHDFPFPFN